LNNRTWFDVRRWFPRPPSTPACTLLIGCLSMIMFGCGGSKAGNENSKAASQPKQSQVGTASCSNSFYPVSAGAKWSYKVTAPGSSRSQLTVEISRTGVEFGAFKDHMEFSDGVRTDIGWKCDATGLLSDRVGAFSYEDDPSAFRVEVEGGEGNGVTLPPTDDWKVGYKWSATYSGKGLRTGKDGAQEALGKVEVDSSMVSEENVTVPAGTFDCFLVDSNIHDDLLIKSGEGSGTSWRKSTRVSAWYAKGVGLVRLAYSGDLGTGGLQLLSYPK
jgi:hypothetical protein